MSPPLAHFNIQNKKIIRYGCYIVTFFIFLILISSLCHLLNKETLTTSYRDKNPSISTLTMPSKIKSPW